MIKVSKYAEEIFHAGSVGEGLGVNSIYMQANFDLDFMLTSKNRIVVERQDVSLHKSCSILRLENSSTYPGYANLKLPYTDFNAEYLYGEDFKNELKDSMITEVLSVVLDCNVGSVVTTHGPAKVMDFDWYFLRDPMSAIMSVAKTIDFVRSIRCFEWPSVADEWTNRKRLNWPSIEMMTEIKKMGCDVVATGCHESPTQIKEWRISFVRAERHLIHSLNDAQLKTFVLLKMVFRSRVFGEEFHNTISSYVAKCSFFWVSEEYDGSKWKKCQCLKYLWLCLRKTRCFLETGNCPHYFMRHCNVLNNKLSEEEKQKFPIKIDLFTEISFFKNKIFTLPTLINVTSLDLGENDNFYTIKTRKLNEEWCAHWIFDLIYTTYNDHLMDAIGDLQELLKDFQNKLESCTPVSFYQSFTKFVKCNLVRLKIIAIDGVNLPKNKQLKRLKKLLSKESLHLDTSCLSQATQIAHVYFTRKLFKRVLMIISQIIFKLKQKPYLGMQEMQMLRLCPSFEDEIFDFWDCVDWKPVCNITFFKLEESILSDDLQIELFAAELALKQQRVKKYHLYSVHVHPLVYIYYMKYKCCRHLRNTDNINSAEESYAAITELVKLVLVYTFYEYYSLNLLGCCLKEEGCFKDAMKIFSRAYQKRLHRNSVLYHTALLLRKAFNDFEPTVTDPKIWRDWSETHRVVPCKTCTVPLKKRKTSKAKKKKSG